MKLCSFTVTYLCKWGNSPRFLKKNLVHIDKRNCPPCLCSKNCSDMAMGLCIRWYFDIVVRKRLPHRRQDIGLRFGRPIESRRCKRMWLRRRRRSCLRRESVGRCLGLAGLCIDPLYGEKRFNMSTKRKKNARTETRNVYQYLGFLWGKLFCSMSEDRRYRGRFPFSLLFSFLLFVQPFVKKTGRAQAEELEHISSIKML